MSRFLNVLRSWLVIVSIIAMGNTLQSFRDHTFLYEKLYTGKPDLVNGLQARTFGIWTLLSSVIRCFCAIDIHNKTFLCLWNAAWTTVPGGRASVPAQEEKMKPCVHLRFASITYPWLSLPLLCSLPTYPGVFSLLGHQPPFAPPFS
ncbi:probable ergosterol biosynthetic protein 28 isoform X3 [Vombatus ursinus]|uniref:Ergosterol biosynthesis 28 homolog n=1 Tax=Vombatus ursinus TaxID=29139 RepID=A0A4X2L580_VOMUR|nr:probable ergosterol biosynthetic protein 28 isoform X3 [Vombatus ursinus]XP_027714323.1 probable ergosterol biosynthetic protein 28 isoform X3 [Vombatus ursinus]